MSPSLKLFRKLQLTTSVILFFLVFLICYKVTGFDLTTIPLSRWGITKGVDWLWNSCLVVLATSCFFNIYHYIKYHPQLCFKKYFRITFLVQCASIVVIALVVSGNIIHSIVAYFYFFMTPLAIFLLAAVNRCRLTFLEWLTHTSLSVFMIVLPLIALFTFHGKAIAETIHSVLFIVWNAYLLKENV